MNTSKAANPRQRIIDTSIALFYQQGYSATGINQIISEAKVAKASFYYHFSTKDDLCITYLREAHEGWFSRLRKFSNSNEKDLDRLLSIFDFLERFMGKTGYRGCSLLNLIPEVPDSNSKIRQEILLQKNRFREFIKDLVKSLKESSSRHSHINVGFLSDATYILIEGALVESQNYSDPWPIVSAKKAVEALVRQP